MWVVLLMSPLLCGIRCAFACDGVCVVGIPMRRWEVLMCVDGKVMTLLSMMVG